MTRDPKTGHYHHEKFEKFEQAESRAERKVVPITGPEGPSQEDQAVAKLKQLQPQALAVRNAMDFCVKHISVERLIMENLPLEATIAYAARHGCTMMNAREYVARRMAEGVDSQLQKEQAE